MFKFHVENDGWRDGVMVGYLIQIPTRELNVSQLVNSEFCTTLTLRLRIGVSAQTGRPSYFEALAPVLAWAVKRLYLSPSSVLSPQALLSLCQSLRVTNRWA